MRDEWNLGTDVSGERGSARCFAFNVCVLGRLTMFFKRERKQRKIRFGERRKVMFHLFNKYLLSTYYVPGLFWGG